MPADLLGIYVGALLLGTVLAYFVSSILFSYFFLNRFPKFSHQAIRSLLILCAVAAVIFVVSFSIPNPELGNRLLHGAGGGFLATFLCLRIFNDLHIKPRLFQFLLFTALAVAAMGVANEVMEYFLQEYSFLIFSNNMNDTWLDLLCNSIGTAVGLIVCAPFVRTK